MASEKTAATQNETPSEGFELVEGQMNVFKNLRQEVGSKQPDYWGKVVIDGVEKKISLWKKVGKTSGEAYLSGNVQAYGKPEDVDFGL